MFFILNGLGGLKTKLETFIGNIHNNGVGIIYAVLNFLIMGTSIGRGEGNVKLGRAKGDAGFFDGTND